MDRYTHIIGGEHRESSQVFPDDNPAHPGDILGLFPSGDAAAVDAAVAAATDASRGWAEMAAPARGAILSEAAHILRRRAEELATDIAREVGKPIAEARGEVTRSAVILEYFAAQARMPQGDIFASDDPATTIAVFRRPLGVVGLITPWNFPLAIPLWKLAPALVYGNTVVLKPAEQSPLLAAKMANLFADAHMLPGVFNVVFGGPETGKLVLAHADVSAISFTGSTVVGRQVATAVLARGARAQTEMGGKNAVIVLSDADLSVASDVIIEGAVSYAGQKCSGTSRVIAEASIHDELVSLLAERLEGVIVGDPLDARARVGPLIDEEAAQRTVDYVRLARDEGARLIVGGERVDSPGWFVRPGLLDQVHPESRFAQEEVFGPLVGVIRAADEDEAVELCNQTRYGLVASLCTNRMDAVLRLAPRIRAGILKVNSPTSGVEPHVPFGGWGDSGNYSPEQGLAAREFYTELQTVYLKGTMPHRDVRA